jgi:hypothetical protein
MLFYEPISPCFSQLFVLPELDLLELVLDKLQALHLIVPAPHHRFPEKVLQFTASLGVVLMSLSLDHAPSLI